MRLNEAKSKIDLVTRGSHDAALLCNLREISNSSAGSGALSALESTLQRSETELISKCFEAPQSISLN